MTSFPLMAVATEASRRGVPTLLVGGKIVSVGDPVLRGLPLIGTRFGRSVDAVASRIGFGRAPDLPPIVAVDRFGEAMLLDPVLDASCEVGTEPSIVVDAALRSLGLGTPSPTRSVADYLDAVWLDRALATTLNAPLGEPPDWRTLAGLHPAAPASTRLISPEHLVHHRRSAAVGWVAFRDAMINRSARWPPITGALAAWFDAGSLSRHLFAMLPEPDVVRLELAELLAPDDADRIDVVVAA